LVLEKKPNAVAQDFMDVLNEYHASISVNGKEEEEETQVREGAFGERKNCPWEGEMKFVISIRT